MTDAQEDSLKRIQHEMREHFESGLVIVETEDEREMQYHGGCPNALGLSVIAKDRLLKRIRDEYAD